MVNKSFLSSSIKFFVFFFRCGRGLFQKCVSIVKKQANKVVPDDYKLLTYLIFDAPTHGGKYEDRMKWLQENISQDDDKCFATVVGIKKCEGLAQLKQYLADVNKVGGEGIMLRKPGSHYEHKRSTTLLKVKTFYDEEALIVGHKQSKSLTGMVGALECELPNGKRFDVGSGLNFDQRRKPPKIGSVITFKFQELSNNGHPRFPTFLRVRNDLTWNDVLEAAKTKKPMSIIQKIIPSAKLSKQHSILFSVVPSRDAKTGNKIVTSDDEDDEVATTSTTTAAASSSSSSSSKPADTRKMCQYGAKCYRTNLDHFKQFQHPSSTKSPTNDIPTKPTTNDAPTKPPCQFGAKCFRTSSVHLATYSHPTKTDTKETSEEEILDTRELIEAEEPVSPTTIDNILIKDKNKGLTFDDDDSNDNQDHEMVTRPKSDWVKLENKLKEQGKRLAHLEETFKTTKRSLSIPDDEQTKRLKTD